MSEALLPARPSLGANPQPSKRQIDIIEDHDQVARRIPDLKFSDGCHHGVAGAVHEGMGLEQCRLEGLPFGSSKPTDTQPAATAALLEIDTPRLGKMVDHTESDVMTRDRVPVARIPETHDKLHEVSSVRAVAKGNPRGAVGSGIVSLAAIRSGLFLLGRIAGALACSSLVALGLLGVLFR